MDNLQLVIGKRKYNSKPPSVGILRQFLKFKSLLEEKGSFDNDVIEQLSILINKAYPSISKKVIERMSVNEYILAANNISKWLAKVLKDAEKKL